MFSRQHIAKLLPFFIIAAGVIILNLLSSQTLSRCYIIIADFLFTDTNWVQSHVGDISDFGHIIAAFCLTLTLLMTSSMRKRYILLFLVLFTLSCEAAQFFTPTRQAKLLDVAAGIAGITLASICHYTFTILSKPPTKP